MTRAKHVEPSRGPKKAGTRPVVVNFTDTEFAILQAAADAAMRSATQQARWMITQALAALKVGAP